MLEITALNIAYKLERLEALNQTITPMANRMYRRDTGRMQVCTV